MRGQGGGTGVGKVCVRMVEVARNGSGQGHRAQQFIQEAGTIIIGAGDGHGDGHVGGN